jgi:hypothetical protein
MEPDSPHSSDQGAVATHCGSVISIHMPPSEFRRHHRMHSSIWGSAHSPEAKNKGTTTCTASRQLRACPTMFMGVLHYVRPPTDTKQTAHPRLQHRTGFVGLWPAGHVSTATTTADVGWTDSTEMPQCYRGGTKSDDGYCATRPR